MKEIFLKVILMFIAAGIAVPLLISMWPRETVVVKEDRALTSTVVIPNDWVEYKNDTLSLWHPPRISQSDTAIVSGFTTVVTPTIATFNDSSTTRTETDAPFDGFSLYRYDLSTNEANITFDQFIGAEKVQMQENFAVMNGSESPMPEITTETLTLGEHEVTKVNTPFGSITMYYLPLTTSSEILLFSGVEASNDSFLPELEDIIKTVTITDNR